MITTIEYNKISKNAHNAVFDVFNHVKSRSLENFIVIISDLVYKSIDGNPKCYCFDTDSNQKEHTRLTFFQDFLNGYYTFNGQEKIEDDKYRSHIEMMVYSHIWESEAFLKKLYQLSYVAEHNKIDWNPLVPEMKKDTFINDVICKGFENCGLKLSRVIKDGYDESIRNAFAHSDYILDEYEKYIKIVHEGSKRDKVSYDDWTKRFVYSFMINYYVLVIMRDSRKMLFGEFGTNEFGITVSDTTYVKIKYLDDKDEFVGI